MLKTGMIIAERYEILGKIGTGGMADVYKAKDHKLNRFVAVKVLKPEFREDTTFIRKFKSEAQAAAVLTHPNIVNVFDVGDDNGVYYIVMDSLPNPYIQQNLAFSFQLEYQAAQYYPQFYRGIYLAGYRYNLHLRPRSLLLEAGAQTNTVQEVKNAMEPFADILDKVLQG